MGTYSSYFTLLHLLLILILLLLFLLLLLPPLLRLLSACYFLHFLSIYLFTFQLPPTLIPMALVLLLAIFNIIFFVVAGAGDGGCRSFVLFCFVLFCFVLFCFVLFCF